MPGIIVALAACVYLLAANAVLGPGGNDKSVERYNENAREFIEYVKGNDVPAEKDNE